jgi:hypothetical protein
MLHSAGVLFCCSVLLLVWVVWVCSAAALVSCGPAGALLCPCTCACVLFVLGESVEYNLAGWLATHCALVRVGGKLPREPPHGRVCVIGPSDLECAMRCALLASLQVTTLGVCSRHQRRLCLSAASLPFNARSLVGGLACPPTLQKA